ncbi:unnamed protein product [Lampetra fluviatilis]
MGARAPGRDVSAGGSQSAAPCAAQEKQRLFRLAAGLDPDPVRVFLRTGGGGTRTRILEPDLEPGPHSDPAPIPRRGPPERSGGDDEDDDGGRRAARPGAGGGCGDVEESSVVVV